VRGAVNGIGIEPIANLIDGGVELRWRPTVEVQGELYFVCGAEVGDRDPDPGESALLR
jgi:hypothetical protein